MSRYVFKLPDLGEGVVEGEVIAWHVKQGDRVAEDQPLVDVMTDKATVTIPSVVGGQVVRTNGEVGDMVAVGGDLVELEVAEATVPEHSPETQQAPAGVGLQVREGHPPPMRAPSTPAPGEIFPTLPEPSPERPLASPAVRRRAREKKVDLKLLKGTGRGGRITDADIDAHLKEGHPPQNGQGRARRTGTTEIHIAGLRRRIAEKMTFSSKHIPHFSYIEQVDITELAKLRHHLNGKRTSDEAKITYLPFIMLALVKAFRVHPEANAHYNDERELVTRFEAVHLGIATQTERGLYVPVVPHVETMDLWEAARELRRVTQAAHHNTIRREELTGSTFTITSLGVMGGLGATPIINHPEVAIMGVHKAYDRPVAENGQVVVRHMVNLSASFDHRVVDGAEGASLIQTIKDYLEHPATIFL